MKLIDHVAHVGLLTPRLEESTAFFRDVIGMEVVAEVGDSVYLRTWGEYLHHTLVLTAGPRPALRHVAWRAEDPDALAEAARRIDATGRGIGWGDGGPGQGASYRFEGPNGQTLELFWDSDTWNTPTDLQSVFPSRPQKFTGRGVRARYLDHVNFPAADPLGDASWFGEVLNMRLLEWTQLRDSETSIFATLTSGGPFDLALLRDESGIRGRFHHLALWVDDRTDVLNAGDLFREHGVPIEWGPGRHGHGESMSVYVREPGGMRVEIVSGGMRTLPAGFPPVMWHPDQGSADFYLSNPLPEAFMEVLPAVDASTGITIGDDNTNPWGKANQ